MSEHHPKFEYSGHLVPGFGYAVIGILWTCKAAYKNTFWQQSNIKHPRALLKSIDFWDALFFTATAVIATSLHQIFTMGGFELLATDGKYTKLSYWQHTTIHFVFIFAGGSKLVWLLYPNTFPYWIGNLMKFLAFFNEGFNLLSHSHDRTPLNKSMHKHALYITWATSLLFAILAVVDQKSSNSSKLHLKTKDEKNALLKCDTNDKTTTSAKRDKSPLKKSQTLVNMIEWLIGVITITHGTWFIQMGHALFSKHSWDEENPMIVPFAAIFFMWHVYAAVLFGIFVYVAAKLYLFSMTKNKVQI